MAPAICAILFICAVQGVLHVRAGQESGPELWSNAPPLPMIDGGAFASNSLLSDGAVQLDFASTLLGPESFAALDGRLYASVAYGAVVLLPPLSSSSAETSFFTPAAVKKWPIGRHALHPQHAPCYAAAHAGNLTAEKECGRPLGLRAHGEWLYVADAKFGIFRFRPDSSAAVDWMVRPEDVQPRARFFNDVDVDDNGRIYFTDSSQRWSRREALQAVLANLGDGRLFRASAKGGVPELLLDGLYFPNGVQLLNKSTLLVAETGRMRVSACKGLDRSRGCSLAPFAPFLPCPVDNIRLNAAKDGLLVACAALIAAGPRPNSLYSFWTHGGDFQATLKKAAAELDQHGLVLQLTLAGQPMLSWHDPSGRVAHAVSQATEFGGYLWLGSAFNHFAVRVPSRQ